MLNLSISIQVETIKDQIKYLKDALDKHLDTSRKREVALVASEKATDEKQTPGTPGGPDDNQEQIIKLKSLLSTKREQIATLRYSGTCGFSGLIHLALTDFLA